MSAQNVSTGSTKPDHKRTPPFLQTPRMISVAALALAIFGGTLTSLPTTSLASECLLDTNNNDTPDAGDTAEGADATGSANNTACGPDADASGTGSINTAIGTSADASGNNGLNSAFGDFANASGNESINTATGDQADASGEDSANTATGSNANASGDGSSNNAIGVVANASGAGSRNVALGLLANASGDGTTNLAVGSNSVATGNNASAFGAGASATHANSTAIGRGAATERDNQMTYGNSDGSNTHTMRGLTSAASTAAQGAVQGVVTTDANGNLSSDGGALQTQVNTNTGNIATNTMDIAALNQSVANINQQFTDLGQRDEELADGIAIALALEQPLLLDGQRFALRFGYGNFDGESAVGVSASGLLSRGNFGPGSSVIVDAGVGFGTQTKTVAARGGVTIGW